MLFHHLVYKVQSTEARSLRAQDGTAPFNALACQGGTMELRGQLLVHAKEVADFASAYADVAGGHVHVRSDDLIEFAHECLAEAHDLCLALAAWREVTAALATAHRQCGQCVLECLFKSEELQDAEVYRCVEAQTALIGTDGTVELHTVADVDLHLTLVVYPGHTEGRDALGFYNALYNLRLLKLGVLVVNVLNRFKDFSYSLKILYFSWMLLLQSLHDFLYVHSIVYF